MDRPRRCGHAFSVIRFGPSPHCSLMTTVAVPEPSAGKAVNEPRADDAAATDHEREGSALESATSAGTDRLRSMFAAHFEFVWRSLRRLGLTDDQADDAAQQVFMVAARRLSTIEVGKEKSFLFGTATRVASDLRRSAPYRREIAHVDPGIDLEGAACPEELLEQRRARALLDEVLNGMAPDLRSVFVLFELEEMTLTEIASLLDLPRGTVASRLRRARERFQSRLERLQRGGREKVRETAFCLVETDLRRGHS